MLYMTCLSPPSGSLALLSGEFLAIPLVKSEKSIWCNCETILYETQKLIGFKQLLRIADFVQSDLAGPLWKTIPLILKNVSTFFKISIIFVSIHYCYYVHKNLHKYTQSRMDIYENAVYGMALWNKTNIKNRLHKKNQQDNLQQRDWSVRSFIY